MGSIVITKNLILFNNLGTDHSSRQESEDSCGGVYWERGIDHIRNVSTSLARNALWDCVGGREEERRDICIERVRK